MCSHRSQTSLWSTSTDEQGKTGCILDGALVSSGFITDLTIMKQSKSFVAANSLKHLIHYDYGSSDINGIYKLSHAHADDITGVSRDPSNVPQFVSCSKDHTVVMWDLRIHGPGVKTLLFRSEQLTFQSIHWCDAEENRGLIMAGANDGFIYSIDVRRPRSIVAKLKVANTSVLKIAFDG